MNYIILITFFTLAGGLVFFFLSRRKHRRAHLESLKLKLYLIRLPRRSKEGKELKTEIATTEQFLSSLFGFGKPFVFEVAVPYVGEEIHFYAAIDSSYGESFVRQVQSLWGDAQVQAAEDYNIFNYSGVNIGARIHLKERFVLPVRTYDELNMDTFLPFLGGFTKVNQVGEGAVFQKKPFAGHCKARETSF